MPDDTTSPSRRDFLTGRAARSQVEAAGERLADALTERDPQGRPEPTGGDTIRLTTQAMACEFAVILNPGGDIRFDAASDALDLVHRLENQMSVYRDHSELSQINREAAEHPVTVERQLFQLLQQSCRLCEETQGAFDPTGGPLIALWRACRAAARLPEESEIAAARARMGVDKVEFDATAPTIQYRQSGLEINLGGIGKGYALDRVAQSLNDSGLQDYLIHGGHSSLLARGDHLGRGGWPVGIRHPLFPHKRLATILLRDQALSSSGTGVQHFRIAGQRYGHILDPRTGWPAEGMLSVTVLAPTAALADSLSTAFFVFGVENARRYCDNNPQVSALLVPAPSRGSQLAPIVCGLPDEQLFWTPADRADQSAPGQ